MTAMKWGIAVITALTIATQTRQTQTTTARETPVLWTSMEMVGLHIFPIKNPKNVNLVFLIFKVLLLIARNTE